MKFSLLAGTAWIVLGIGGASAADLPRKAPAPAPVVVAPSWTGVYIGAMISERVTDVDFTATSIRTPAIVPDPTTAAASFGNTSVRGGGYLGYNWQAGNFVFGIEGDVAAGNNTDRHFGIPGARGAQAGAVIDVTTDSTRVRLGWDASVRGRIGYVVVPGVMLFGTGGGAFQNVEATLSCTQTTPNPPPPVGGSFCNAGSKAENFSSTRTGWTAGAGLEALLSDYWTGKIEYRYADFGGLGHTFFANSAADVLASRINVVTHTVTVGIALKFGVGGAPVVARY